MNINIDSELEWMRNFKAASSLPADQFEALLAGQRRLFETLAPKMTRDKRSGAYGAPGYRSCHDCGALIPECDGCPICETVNRDKLPVMAYGFVLGPPPAMTCDHIVGHIDARPAYDSFEGGYTVELSRYADGGRYGSGDIELFNFCPTCGERIDLGPIHAAWDAKDAQEDADDAERRRLLTWPV
jgi:hypothetical protein